MFATRFSKYAWAVVFFNILVIVWGAVVRATGSGAGCGSHWPTCNGEIVPTLHQVEVLVEFAHRISSALAGLLVLILLVWAFRRQGWNLTRKAAVASLVFILIEGAIGALLVRLELTAKNATPLRALMIAIHLVNTLLLMGALTLTAWSGAQTARRIWQPQAVRGRTQPGLLLAIGIIGVILLCAAGAVTALGDTLFPSTSLAAGMAADLDAGSNILIRLRVLHPAIAVITSIYLLIAGRVIMRAVPKEPAEDAFNFLQTLIVIQIGVGVMNVALLAPVTLQLIHLLLADAIWIGLVLFTVETLVAPGAKPVTAQPGQNAALQPSTAR